jgi:hypothetical protein
MGNNNDITQLIENNLLNISEFTYESGEKRDPTNLNDLSAFNYVYATDLNDISIVLNNLINNSNISRNILSYINDDITVISGLLSDLTSGENLYEKLVELSGKFITLQTFVNNEKYFNENYQDIILSDLQCTSADSNFAGIYEYDVQNSVITPTASVLIWKNYNTNTILQHKITANNTFKHEYFIFDNNSNIAYKNLDLYAYNSILNVNWYDTENNKSDIGFSYFKLSNYILDNKFSSVQTELTKLSNDINTLSINMDNTDAEILNTLSTEITQVSAYIDNSVNNLNTELTDNFNSSINALSTMIINNRAADSDDIIYIKLPGTVSYVDDIFIKSLQFDETTNSSYLIWKRYW